MFSYPLVLGGTGTISITYLIPVLLGLDGELVWSPSTDTEINWYLLVFIGI